MIFPFDGTFSPQFHSPISPQSAFSGSIWEEIQMYNNKKYARLCFTYSQNRAYLAGVAGFEPTNDGVRGLFIYSNMHIYHYIFACYWVKCEYILIIYIMFQIYSNFVPTVITLPLLILLSKSNTIRFII